MPVKDSSRGGHVLSLTCMHCGASYTKYAGDQKSEKTFCSRACRWAAHKASRTPRDPAVVAERQRQATLRMYERRRQWYAEFMKGRACAVCGKTRDDGVKMHWHHRDPKTKRFNISRGVPIQPQARLVEEIARCDLLCHPCHVEAHRKLRNIVLCT